MKVECYFKNWGFEFIYERHKNLYQSILLIIGNKKWKSKKTYMIFNKKYFKDLSNKHFYIKYLPFNIMHTGVDINHKNIPFMFTLHM